MDIFQRSPFVVFSKGPFSKKGGELTHTCVPTLLLWDLSAKMSIEIIFLLATHFLGGGVDKKRFCPTLQERIPLMEKSDDADKETFSAEVPKKLRKPTTIIISD